MNLLRVFVYGTLKTGYRNHHYMKDAVSREETTVLGRLYRRYTGTPILEVPRASVLAYGTEDFTADLKTQESVAGGLGSFIPPAAGEEWTGVRGEVYTFRDPAAALAALDELEEYVPGPPEPAGEAAVRSLYDRVLIPVGRGGGQVAWAYVIPSHLGPEDYRPAVDPANWRAEVEVSWAVEDGRPGPDADSDG